MTLMRFEGTNLVRPRKAGVKIRGVVLHWTAGSGTARQCFDVLSNRGVSCHAHNSAAGTLTTFAADSLVTFHAGQANEAFLGLEQTNPGISDDRRHRKTWPPYVDTIEKNGVFHRKEMLSFTLLQLEAMAEWVEEKARLHGFPLAIPIEKNRSLCRRKISQDEFDSFSGVLGHFHIPESVEQLRAGKRNTKLDPGTQPFYYLADRWGISLSSPRPAFGSPW